MVENKDREENIPSDIPEGYSEKIREKERAELEKTTLGFWGSWVKRNWKHIFMIVGGIALAVFLIITRQLLILFGMGIFAGSCGFGYFFWKALIEVPRIAVAEIQNKNRRSNLYLIPKNLFPNFEIVGTPHFFKDVDSGKEVLPADFVNLDKGLIKCAYDFDVSNLSLSYNLEAIEVSESRAVEMIEENHKLNDEVDEELLAEIEKPGQERR